MPVLQVPHEINTKKGEIKYLSLVIDRCDVSKITQWQILFELQGKYSLICPYCNSTISNTRHIIQNGSDEYSFLRETVHTALFYAMVCL